MELAPERQRIERDTRFELDGLRKTDLGIYSLSEVIVVAAIGDICRFPSAKKLVGYAGLVASVHASGQSQHIGHTTKQGPKEIPHILVEAAWVAIEEHPHWKARFAHFAARMPRSKAIVAISRELLVLVCHILTDKAADRHADVEGVAFRLVAWAAKLGPQGRRRLKRASFVRRRLAILGVGNELEVICRDSRRYRLPPAEAVAAQTTQHRINEHRDRHIPTVTKIPLWVREARLSGAS